MGGSSGETGLAGGFGSDDTQEQLLRAILRGAYRLVGARASIDAGGRNYTFQLQWVDGSAPGVEDPGFQVGGCSVIGEPEGGGIGSWTVLADLAETWPRENGDFFSLFTPTGFDTGSGDGLAGAAVQMGVFDFESGEEWSVVPNRRSWLYCARLPPPGADDPSPSDPIGCAIGWQGVMSENFTSEKSFGLATIFCLFGPRADEQCLREGCDDGNPCTFDYCTPLAGCLSVPLDEVSFGDTVAGEFYERFARQCDANGSPGLCRDGECVPDPCGEECRTELMYDEEANECTYRFCDTQFDPVCLTDTIPECSG